MRQLRAFPLEDRDERLLEILCLSGVNRVMRPAGEPDRESERPGGRRDVVLDVVTCQRVEAILFLLVHNDPPLVFVSIYHPSIRE